MPGRNGRATLSAAVLLALPFAGCAPAAPGPTTPPATSTTVVRPSDTSATPPTPAPPPKAPPPQTIPSCLEVARSLPIARRVGQLYMVGASTAGLDDETVSALTDSGVGSVVLLGNSTAGAGAISALTARIAELGGPGPPILIAADQEGGRVQRLRGPGFDDIPTAREQARLPAGELRERARAWGAQLAAAGVRYNLAPVADVVPAVKQRSNAPIGALDRNYGNDVATTSRAVAEFVAGMGESGVATSLKHFPGLGQVTKNTDFDVAVDDDVVPDDPGWEAFRAGIAAGASSVMVSSGVFTRLDPDTQGVFSAVVVTDMLRGRLGFDGVVIADDLGAAAAVADVPPAERGVRFIAAGGDLVIDADPGLIPDMVAATLARVAADERFAGLVDDSAARVLRLKAGLGLLACS